MIRNSFYFFLFFGFGALSTFPVCAKGFLVFGAASSRQPLEAAGKAFARQGGSLPRFSFAASSTLARQIGEGAKAEVFLSANQQWMDFLEQKNLLQQGMRQNLCGNRLILVGSPYVDFTDAHWPEDMTKYLKGKRLSIGDPAHVPAGIYARRALSALGLWKRVQGQLARGNSVSQALVWVQLGEAPLGVVYASDLQGLKKLRALYRFPASSHQPILYPLALIKGAGLEARGFYRFLLSPKGRAFFTRYGFTDVD